MCGGGLGGAKEHAIKQVQAGVDVLVAQGTKPGHCGEVTTMVLVPEVIEAIREVRDVPVLAAGGIVTGRQMAAAVALVRPCVDRIGVVDHRGGSFEDGALHRPEAARRPESPDTVRWKARTGKPSRQLRSAWTRAWDADAGGPGPPCRCRCSR